MRLHVRYSGKMNTSTTNVPDGDPAAILRQCLEGAYRRDPTREAMAFVEDRNGLVSMYGMSFFKDPDGSPYYSLRAITPTPFATVRDWDEEDFGGDIQSISNFDVGQEAA